MGGKGGYEEPESSQQLSRIANQLFAQTGPIRNELIGRGNAFMQGDLDVTQSPMYGALKAGTESGYDQGKDLLMGLLPAGGQLNQGLTSLAADRAKATAQNYGALAQEELARSMGMGFDTLGTTMSGLQTSANAQAGAMQSQAASDQAKGESIGKMAGSIGMGMMMMSDRRLKRDIVPLNEALSVLMDLPVYRFEYTFAPGSGEVGVIADELREVMPSAVSKQDGYLLVNYAKLVPLLIGAVRELSGKVQALQAKS